jgi:hypothetical protein
MIQKIKNYLLMSASALMLAMPVAIPAMASAADTVCGAGSIGDSISKGANGAASSNATSTCADQTSVNDDGLAKLGRKVVNLFSLVIGIIAIIMIIYGGFRYITSGGASERVGNAKNTLIYAIVGLIIVALAQIIVHFVLNQTNAAVQGAGVMLL